MAAAEHSHTHKHDPACEKPHPTEPGVKAIPEKAQETSAGPRRSKRTHPPSAKAVEIAQGGVVEEPPKRQRTADKESSGVASPATGAAAVSSGSPSSSSARKKSPAQPSRAAKAKAKQAELAQEAAVTERMQSMDRLTETPSCFIRLLCDTKVEDFEWHKNKDKPIFVCNRNDRVVDVFKGMIRHNLQSVPVMTQDDRKYHSFIDLHDIVHWVVEHFQDKLTGEASHDFWKLIEQEHAFLDRRVRELEERPYSSKQKFHPIIMGFSLFSVFEAMWRIPGLRRVAIVTNDYQLLNLHTQSQMIDFLVENMPLLGKKAKKALHRCPFFKSVHCIEEKETAFKAFQMMSDKKITGVAVCDANGRLKGNLSVRDLKILSGDLRLFWRLQQTAKNFITKLREEFQARHKRPQRLVYARDSDTIEIVLHQLQQHKIHRVYIVDSRRLPIGIVSLRDMLGEILSEKKNAVPALCDAYRNELREAALAAGGGAERPISPIERIHGVDFEAADAEPFVPLTVPAIPPPALPYAPPMPPLSTMAPPKPTPITFVPTEGTAHQIPVGVGVSLPPHAQPPQVPGTVHAPGAVGVKTDATVVSGAAAVPLPATSLVPGMPGVAGVALPAVAATVGGESAVAPLPPPGAKPVPVTYPLPHQ